MRQLNNQILVNKDKIVEYVENMVPRILPLKEIKDNQRYYVSLLIRKNSNISYSLREEVCDLLLKDITVSGNQNTILDIDEIMSQCNMSRLIKYLYRKELYE